MSSPSARRALPIAALLLTWATQSAAEPCSQAVRAEGTGDLRADDVAIVACRQCAGEEASLQFFPAGSGSPGYTYCRQPDGRGKRSSTYSSVHLRAACGEGVGDLRDAAGAAQKCAKCNGDSAFLKVYFSPAEGLLRTFCEKGSPAAKIHAAMPCVKAAGAEGAGDLRGEVAAIKACKACDGKNAELQFFPKGKEGHGFTYCRVIDGRGSRTGMDRAIGMNAKCGEGMGDTRKVKGAAEKCVKCKGMEAVLDHHLVAAEGVWATFCVEQP